ncbi:retrovirus-related pol polyprotein from transposon TNT 1-94 [Tanacetum coccineum]
MVEFEKLVNASRAKKLEKSHDPLALVAHTGSSSRNTTPYYATHPSSVVDYDDDYQRDVVQNNSEDPLTSAMLVNIQSKNSGNNDRITRRAYIQEEVVEGTNVQNDAGNVQRTLRTSSPGTTANVQCYNCSEKGHYARNCPKLRVRDSKYFMEQMLLAKQDEAGVILTDEQNDFLFANASRMEEIEDEVRTPSTSNNQEQKYPNQPKIINKTIGDDQIDSNIIFDEPNGNVNSGSVEKDNNVHDLYALEQLARNAYKEAEKQQILARKVHDQNTSLINELESYKEKVWVLKVNKGDKINYFHEYIEADRKAKCFDQEAQSQFVHDRDIIRDLKAKLKKNVDIMLKIGNSLQGMFMLGPKPLSVYDPKLKHGLGYPNPYTLKQAISRCPKLYLASSLNNSEIPLNVKDTEDILDDASKSQMKMKEKK